MDYLSVVFIFILGLIIGSFLNVVIYRYNTGKSLGGRSQCLACGKVLHWYELVPVFSYLLQRGRCRGCGSKFSWQYPAVELATAILFASSWLLPLSFVSHLIYLAAIALLVVIAAYDFRHLIIPDGPVYAFALLGLLEAALTNALWPRLLAGLGLTAFFWILWGVSRGRWLGFADGKLALGLGFFLGATDGISAVVLAFWIGAAVGLALIAYSRLSARFGRVTMKSELPFAPFLILGFLLVLLLNIHVLPL
jgi:leader peptidase (prepilin peptidase)/N-methyltransferase